MVVYQILDLRAEFRLLYGEHFNIAPEAFNG